MQGEEKPQFYAETASIYLGFFYINYLPTKVTNEIDTD